MASAPPWVAVVNPKQLNCVQVPTSDQKYTFHWRDAVASGSMNCGVVLWEGDRGNGDRKMMCNEIEMPIKAERGRWVLPRNKLWWKEERGGGIEGVLKKLTNKKWCTYNLCNCVRRLLWNSCEEHVAGESQPLKRVMRSWKCYRKQQTLMLCTLNPR